MTRSRNPGELFALAKAGNRTALARLVSMVEAGGFKAEEVAELVHPNGGRAYTIGITGSPGAGKSTLTDHFIAELRGAGHDVAVLAIDPSSPFTGGAILGDRVRMSSHYADTGVYIRSMATRGHLGGLALAAPAVVRLLDAVGFDIVLVETVGVGQVEVEIAGAADTTVVVVNPGWGDTVQANKAGIMEIADIFVINKADRAGADQTEADLRGMLEMSGYHGEEVDGRWCPPIVRTVAVEGRGVDGLAAAATSHREYQVRTGALEGRRRQRLSVEITETLARVFEARARARCVGDEYEALVEAVLARQVTPQAAALRLAD